MKMDVRKVASLFLIMCLAACGSGTSGVSANNSGSAGTSANTQPEKESTSPEEHQPVTIKTSSDKYTAYVKDYVGKNCATFGYESMGGDRNDKYNSAYIELQLVTEDGTYVGISDEELKSYVVVAQSIEPNTEIKMTYQVDSEGKEFSNLIAWQNLEEIVLKVKKVSSKDAVTDKGMTPINVSPDKYTYYVKDYTGRNLANCGYISMAGDLRDRYGKSNVKMIVNANDGSYIEMNEEMLPKYMVVKQSPEPNTEMKLEYTKKSDGEEYDNLIDWQSLEEIELFVEEIK